MIKNLFPIPNLVLSENEEFTEKDLQIKVFDFDPNQDSTSIFSDFFASKIQETIYYLLNIEPIFKELDKFIDIFRNMVQLKDKLPIIIDFFQAQKACIYKIWDSLNKNTILNSAPFSKALVGDLLKALEDYFKENSKNYPSINKEHFFQKMISDKEKVFKILKDDEPSYLDFLDILDKIHTIFYYWNRIKYKLYPKDANLLNIGDI